MLVVALLFFFLTLVHLKKREDTTYFYPKHRPIAFNNRRKNSKHVDISKGAIKSKALSYTFLALKGDEEPLSAEDAGKNLSQAMALDIRRALNNSDKFVDIGFNSNNLISLVRRGSVKFLVAYVAIILVLFTAGMFIVLSMPMEPAKSRAASPRRVAVI